MSDSLPEPRLVLVYRLQPTRGEPLVYETHLVA